MEFPIYAIALPFRVLFVEAGPLVDELVVVPEFADIAIIVLLPSMTGAIVEFLDAK